MNRDFNLPPGCTSDDVDPPEVDAVESKLEREYERADYLRDLELDAKAEKWPVMPTLEPLEPIMSAEELARRLGK